MIPIYEDKIYKMFIDYCVCTTKYQRNKFSKSIKLYITKGELDYFIDVLMHYDRTKNAISTVYNFSGNIPEEEKSIVDKLRYNSKFVSYIYSILWREINRNNNIRINDLKNNTY